ncbi:MAG: hypothetical protein DMG70_15660 [Acidobacteria bacterium]|nr:MAG: hypothetical protein DMG70_15660 [Acidobacteriota bacterium]
MQDHAHRRAVSHRLAIIACALTPAVLGFAAKEFVRPAAKSAVSYPAHDQHKDEAVTVAVDPYDMPDKAQIFTINYRQEGLLPILVIVTNDSEQPISLSGMKAQLVTVDRAKISPADSDDIYRRLSHPSRADVPLSPLPFPRKKIKGAVSPKALDEIQNAGFNAKAVEPHSTQSGFLFFDVAGMSTPLAGAHFYLTGVRNDKGDELMYFEIPMEKYLSAPPTRSN